MTDFNGVFFSENYLTNATKKISPDETNKPQKFNETKTEDCSNIETIAIDSSVANINVFVSNSTNLTAHFYGKAETDGNVNFIIKTKNNELKIIIQFTKNCRNANLKLNVIIPQKKFNVISANTSSANITLNKGISANFLKVNTQSGNVKTSATFNNFSASTKSGNVKLCIDAIEDNNIDISTMSGNVSAEFYKIKHFNLSTKTMSGNVKNNHKKESNCYNANVNISTMSGDIKII